ncbi:MAG: ankyrin repeat domain-containing protein [Rickettsiales bacterium]|nr:ankyrin repeat domain-containing protein [Rickettsiales bacterium]
MSKNLATGPESNAEEARKFLRRLGVEKINGEGLSEPPLITAVKQGQETVVRILLKAGVNPNVVDGAEFQYSALSWAVFLENLNIAHTLLDFGANKEARSYSGSTPIMTALFAEKFSAFNLLLARGASVDAQDTVGNTLLTFSAERGLHKIAREILQISARSIDFTLNEGFYPSKKRPELFIYPGSTALMIAASMGNREMTQLFLQFGANADLRDAQGNTAAALARMNGYEILSHLIEERESGFRGAELPPQTPAQKLEELRQILHSLKDSAGKKIANTAPQKSEVKTILRLSDELTELNLSNLVTPEGLTILHFAARFGDLADFEKLIAGGAQINAKAEGGVSVLSFALRSGNSGIANAAVGKKDLDFDSITDGLKTALVINRSDYFFKLAKNPKVVIGLKDPEKAAQNTTLLQELRVAAKNDSKVRKVITEFEALVPKEKKLKNKPVKKNVVRPEQEEILLEEESEITQKHSPQPSEATEVADKIAAELPTPPEANSLNLKAASFVPKALLEEQQLINTLFGEGGEFAAGELRDPSSTVEEGSGSRLLKILQQQR